MNNMNIPGPHRWDLVPKEAIALQKDLSQKVTLSPLKKDPKIVAGVDVSYNRGSDIFYAGIVLLKYPEMELIEEVYAIGEVSFPYIPGLLSFREGPVIMKAFKKLDTVPDVTIFDGQGIAHQRGLGIASHIGLLLGLPTIGCAKTKLCGNYEEPGIEKGSCSPLILQAKEAGAVLRSRRSVKSLFVSPGHMIDIPNSINIVLNCCTKYRLPEPTRRAHILVNRVRLADQQ